MLQLEDTHPEVYQPFMGGNISVQLSNKKTFVRIEFDKYTEMTINKDTKMLGGTTEFITNPNSIIRCSKPKKIYTQACQFIFKTLPDAFTPNSSGNPLLRMSYGILPLDDVVSCTRNA